MKHFNLFSAVIAAAALATPLAGIAEMDQSTYGFQVWSVDENGVETPWNTSGGLFRPFRTDAQKYEMDSKYLYTNPSSGLKFFRFCGPLSADEMAKYEHAKKWASDDYREDAKFARETSTELYVIDFTEGVGNDRGLYITVPSVANMTSNPCKPETEGSGLDNVPYFYRMGVRFGLLDMTFGGENDGDPDGYKDHLRYVKWGHCFRLNEISRPVNAFPKFSGVNSEGYRTLVGFTDDFGPCQWNGSFVCEDNQVPGAVGSLYDDNTGNLNALRNKKGDCRLLAERNFYLRRIFLEVARPYNNEYTDAEGYHRAEEGYTHLYLYFEGEYEDENAIDWQFHNKYVGAEGNFVGPTPNIFQAATLQVKQPVFHRFHNLDVSNPDRVQKLIGITVDDYNTRTGKGRYLYDLEFTDSYECNTSYELHNAAGSVLSFFDGDPIGKQLHYNGSEGKFFNAEAVAGADDLIDVDFTELDNVNIIRDPQEMLFDPENPEIAPAAIGFHNVYTFPNQAFATETRQTVNLVNGLIPVSSRIELNAQAKRMNVDHTSFESSLDWSDFASTDGKYGIKPVATYAVSARPVNEGDFAHIIHNGNELRPDNLYWAGNDEKAIERHAFISGEPVNLPFTVEYRIDTWYNLAYMTDAIYPSSVLYENDGVTPGEPFKKVKSDEEFGDNDVDFGDLFNTLGAPSIDFVPVPDDSAASDGVFADGATDGYDLELPSRVVKLSNGISYRIHPVALSATATSVFDENTEMTGVEAVIADSDAPAEYFTLQGQRVAEPLAGQIYIVRRGAKASKVRF